MGGALRGPRGAARGGATTRARRRGGRAHPARARARHAAARLAAAVGRTGSDRPRGRAPGRTATSRTWGRTGCCVRTAADAHEVLVPLAAVVTAATRSARTRRRRAVPGGSGSAMPCGRCRATGPPCGRAGRRRPAAAGDHRRRGRRPPRPRRAPRRGSPGAGRTSRPWRRCRSRRSWRWSHDAEDRNAGLAVAA